MEVLKLENGLTIFFPTVSRFLTYSLIPGVQELCERRGGALALDHARALLVGRQLAEHAGRHALDVLDLVVEQLHEDGDDGEAADDGAVVHLARQDVQRAHRALHDLLHADAVRVRAGVGGTSLAAGTLTGKRRVELLQVPSQT